MEKGQNSPRLSRLSEMAKHDRAVGREECAERRAGDFSKEIWKLVVGNALQDAYRMSEQFFDHPILNSPYECPRRHWELDEDGQPTQKIIETPAQRQVHHADSEAEEAQRPPRKQGFVFDEGKGLSTEEQQYDPTSIINEVRGYVDAWRALPKPNQWQVTPETARLLQHWRHHKFSGVRPFFCQVEAVETAIWLTEVAPQSKNGQADSRPSGRGQQRRQSRTAAPRAETRHRRGQDHRHGDADRLADDQRRAPTRQQDISRAAFWSARPASRSKTACAFSSPTIPTATTPAANSFPATCSTT